MKRPPAVAGQFYYGEASRLEKQVSQYMDAGAEKERVKAALCPHAGLMYSGPVAGAVYSRIIFPDTFVLIGPNHTGLGEPFSIMAEGQWEIPSCVIHIDERLSTLILKNAPDIKNDAGAHMFEHSLEVQLPFLAHVRRDIKIVPLTVMSDSLDRLKDIGEGIAKAVSAAGYPVTIAASSDMSHHVSDDVARRKDRLAIERMLALDPEGLYNVVKKEDISMCGYLPAVIMLYSAKALGASEAKLVKYTTSAEVSGDYDYVVGYAGIIIK